MTNAFSYDLGVFDPTFPGISLHFPNEATWAQLQSINDLILSIVTEDLQLKNPQVSKKDITTEQVLQHVITDLSMSSPLDSADKERLGRALIDHDPEQAVGNLAVASAQVHERRHFHDWLLSPYAAAINALRAEVFINYARLLPALEAGGTTVIPVPLTRWMRKNHYEQAELIQMWQSLLGDTVEVRVPDLTHPDVLSCIKAIEGRYKSIGILFQPVGGVDLDAAAVFEASALLIQTQDINDLLGDTACKVFLNSMVQQDFSSRYTWFFRAMNRLRRPGEVLENNTLSPLATWCLLGSSNADLANANPLTRMFHMVEYVRDRGFPKVATSSHDLFTELDRACGAVPYTEVLTHSVHLGDTVLQALDGMVSADRSGSTFGAGVIEACSLLQECHKYMVGVFLEDPDGYSKPTGYLDRNLEKWPEPPVRYTFGQPFLRVKRGDLPKYEGATLFESESTQEDVFLRQYVMRGSKESIMRGSKESVDIQVADNWQYLCGVVDTVFAEYNRDQPEIEYQREEAKKNGIYLLEVLR